MERKNVNEWAEWNGGEMPVPKGTPIGVRHRDGGEYRELAGARYAEHWDLRGVGSDIVAWRLLGANEGWISRAPGATHPVDANVQVQWVNSEGLGSVANAKDLCWDGLGPVVRYRVMGEVEPELGDGWITWGGGKCPVPNGTLVDVKFRDGEELKGIQANVSQVGFAREATSSYWRHDDLNNDIVAYRVVPEPKHAPEFHVKASRTDEVLKVCKTRKKALKLMEIIHRAGGEAYIKEEAL